MLQCGAVRYAALGSSAVSTLPLSKKSDASFSSTAEENGSQIHNLQAFVTWAMAIARHNYTTGCVAFWRDTCTHVSRQVSAHISRHAEGMRMPKFKGTLRVHEVLCLSDQSHAVLGHLQECVSVSCRRAGEPYW